MLLLAATACCARSLGAGCDGEDEWCGDLPEIADLEGFARPEWVLWDCGDWLLLEDAISGKDPSVSRFYDPETRALFGARVWTGGTLCSEATWGEVPDEACAERAVLAFSEVE